jgi:hypothetical protein
MKSTKRARRAVWWAAGTPTDTAWTTVTQHLSHEAHGELISPSKPRVLRLLLESFIATHITPTHITPKQD